MADLEQQFKDAQERVKTEKRADGSEATNEEKLKVYALFKQATEGDVTGSQPWSVEFSKRAKWDAWNEQKGKSKEDAMKEYIEEVERQLGPKN